MERTRATDGAQVTLERLDSMSDSAERLLRAFVLMLSCDGSNSVIDEGIRAMQGVVNTSNRICATIELRLNGEEVWILSFGAVYWCQRETQNSHNCGAGMLKYRLLIRSQYSTISDSELDRILTSVHHSNPNCGYRMMQGYLARLGHRVQQCRVPDSMARTDP